MFTRFVWLCPRCDEDQVFSAKLDGSGVVWVIHGWSWSPSWSPTGTLIAAATSDGLAIFTDAGERVRRLSRPGSAPAWQAAVP